MLFHGAKCLGNLAPENKRGRRHGDNCDAQYLFDGGSLHVSFPQSDRSFLEQSQRFRSLGRCWDRVSLLTRADDSARPIGEELIDQFKHYWPCLLSRSNDSSFIHQVRRLRRGIYGSNFRVFLLHGKVPRKNPQDLPECQSWRISESRFHRRGQGTSHS